FYLDDAVERGEPFLGFGGIDISRRAHPARFLPMASPACRGRLAGGANNTGDSVPAILERP
ncbi:MAG TPA: hypothetical protein VEX11_10560, partial [Acetobacteraceae bacterium]|nr:hypothetical protein [Acetobacteraceae bacterium]